MQRLIVMWITLILLVGCSSKTTDVNKIEVSNTPTPDIKEEIKDEVIDEVKIDIDSYDSINCIINKDRPLSEDYVPSDLVIPDVPLMKELYMRNDAAEAIKEMFKAAKEEGIYLQIGSGYRSYNYQKNLFNNYVAKDGEEAANRYSARPGESEHQTGLAADIANSSGYCYLKNCFKDTEEGIWLKNNAYKYGFILRFMEDKEDITGYMFEPWHYRYIGKDEAKKVYESGKTLEEYYGIIDK